MEVLVALLTALVVILAVTVIVMALRRPPGDLSALRDTFERQNMLMQEVKSLVEFGDRGQGILREELQRTQRAIERLKADHEARRQLEEESRNIVKRLESVIVGSYSKGQAGENILHEIFKLFPREMIAYDATINGKVVEFGLILSDKKVLPIDSKWPASNLLIALDEERDEKVRRSIVDQIEREVARRVKEVCQYINPDVTSPWAVVAVPDAVFSVCKRAYLDAYKRQVILMSYSMAIPYILTFYSLHLQYSRTVDMENLQSHLITIGRQLGDMEQVLENKLARGTTMLSNAYGELTQQLSRIRASVAYLEATDSGEFDKSLSVEATAEPHIGGTPGG